MLLWNSRKLALARPGVLLANAAITGYQRCISPHKGFRCAYAVLHRSPGCSEAVRQLILRYGLPAAWPHIRQRFTDCKTAMQTLRLQRAQAQAAQSPQTSGEEKTCGRQLGECAACYALDVGTQVACCLLLPC